MASFKAKFPVLQELFAKNHRGALWAPPPPAGRGLMLLMFQVYVSSGSNKISIPVMMRHMNIIENIVRD